MCANYQPVTREDRLLAFFGVVRGDAEIPAELWPLGLAPFIRRAEDGSGNRRIEHGVFGLLPGFAKELAFGRKTYNARAETVAVLPSFSDSWKAGRRPSFRPKPSSSNALKRPRGALVHPAAGAVPMGIAGVYRRWRDRWSFAMLTVNAGGHLAYGRMGNIVLDEPLHGSFA